MRFPRSKLLVYAALTGTAFFWGSGFALARYALRSISPLELLAGQSLATAGSQIIWTAMRGEWAGLHLPARRLWPVLLLGLVGQNLLNGLTVFGLASTTATNAALIYAISPVMIALLAAALLGESFQGRQFVASALGFAGVALVVTQGSIRSVQYRGMLVGNLLVLAATAYWATYTVLTRRLAQGMKPSVYTFYLLTLGALGPIALEMAWEGRFPLLGVDGWTLAAVLFFGISTGTLGFNFWNWGLTQIEASRVGFFSYLEPVFAAAVAVILLGEQVTMPTIIGGSIVLVGVFLSTALPATTGKMARVPKSVDNTSPSSGQY